MNLNVKFFLFFEFKLVTLIDEFRKTYSVIKLFLI